MCYGSKTEISEEVFFNTIRDGTTFAQSASWGKIKEFPEGSCSIVKTNQTGPEWFGLIGPKGPTGPGGEYYPGKKYIDTIRQKILDSYFTIEEIYIDSDCYFYKIKRSPMIKPARKL